ncbi:MAG: YIP1 family protein [Eubacteriales bacterium]
MKKKLTGVLIVAYIACLLFGTLPAAAYEPYTTYTYSMTDSLHSPAAYSANLYVNSEYMLTNAPYKGEWLDIKEPTDIFAAPDQRVYIVDQKNNQVIILNKYYKAVNVLRTFNSDERDNDSFAAPTGVFVNGQYIYVCDTQNNRIVMFTLDGQYYKTVPKPDSPLFGSENPYTPIAMVVDQYNRMFVVSSASYEGVIVMDENANFTGFMGAPKATTLSLWQRIVRRYQEQDESDIANIPSQIQNIAIDGEGFIYLTCVVRDSARQEATLTSKLPDFSPVRKVNSSGDEVMKRNGFFDCSGEVMIGNTIRGAGVSSIVDVAVGPEKSWTIIDSKRSRTYTYDANGVLLFAFGDDGMQLGNVSAIKGITYQGDKMLLLDYANCAFTVFSRTKYGDLLINALANENQNNYSGSIDYWMDVLQFNNNFDAAYIGVGKAYYRAGEYETAMEYLKAAYETENYAKSYAEIRKAWTSKYLLLIPLIVILVVFLLSMFLKYAKRLNEKTTLKIGKKSYWEELIYSFYLIFHPFDGFYDLKHEKRGSVRAGLTIVFISVVCFYYQSVARGYLINTQQSYTGFLLQLTSVLAPILLWTTANWCLTTLFEGEGSYKDIFVASCYSLAPLPLFLVVSTIFSNFMATPDAGFYNLINGIGFVWVGFLLFFGMLVTHDYSLGKNIVTSLATILSMAVIMFVLTLFSSLVGRMVAFVNTIVTEIGYRM